MNDLEPSPAKPAQHRRSRSLILLLGLAAAAIAGGFIARGFAPPPSQSPSVPARPIVQIVRQSSLPSIAPTIDRLCPSIARIVMAGQPTASSTSNAAGKVGFVVSADGWLVTSAPVPSNSNLQAIFGDGRKAPVDDIRSDPVSGLVILHVDAQGLSPLTFADQNFARVGDFGFSLQTSGTGCAASESMVGSDFLVDALAQGVYVRLQPSVSTPPPGVPFLGGDGIVLGVASGAIDNVVLPGPIAAVIVEELIRNDLSPIANFGFRAIDFTPELANRIGEQRSRGAGVALVERNSAAEKS
ncbi:MAG TPA: S1C family serine protease, partial [Sphingomicrobium sp.]|nr:S1C family serine protease [Sphingomicrobium sp.]